MTNFKPHIFSITPEQLEHQFEFWKEKSYRVKQFYNWIFTNRIFELSEMNNLPTSLRQKLSEEYSFYLPRVGKQTESIDKSIKYLLELEDNNRIEMVYMPTAKKQTLCVSTQVGCGRNCLFCATGKIGLKRNLTATEILSQIYLAQTIHHTISNIVFMGMGEPLDNLENVFAALYLLQHERLFSFSPRRITISTAGVIPGINQLAAGKMKVKLAVSLNAVTNDKRNKLMPINKVYPLSDLKKALHCFSRQNPFRITLEYVMIKNFNMFDSDVEELVKFAADLSCKINLIAWNPISSSTFQAPAANEVEEFQQKLYKSNSAVLLRTSRGSDINAACGQLAGEY